MNIMLQANFKTPGGKIVKASCRFEAPPLIWCVHNVSDDPIVIDAFPKELTEIILDHNYWVFRQTFDTPIEVSQEEAEAILNGTQAR